MTLRTSLEAIRAEQGIKLVEHQVGPSAEQLDLVVLFYSFPMDWSVTRPGLWCSQDGTESMEEDRHMPESPLMHPGAVTPLENRGSCLMSMVQEESGVTGDSLPVHGKPDRWPAASVARQGHPRGVTNRHNALEAEHELMLDPDTHDSDESTAEFMELRYPVFLASLPNMGKG